MNQLMDNFYVLSGILIEKCSFWLSSQLNTKSGATDQETFGDRLVDAIDLLATPGLFQCLIRSFSILTQVLYNSQPLLKDSLSLKVL